MLNLFKEHYKFFLSQPVISNSKYCREVTAAYLYVLSDYLLLSRGEHITRQETAQEIFNLLETKILTNEELVRFDKAVDLFGQVMRGEIRARGDWWPADKEMTSGLEKVFFCYGDLIYAPNYIDDYENSPILISGINLVMDFALKFMELKKLSNNYFAGYNDIFERVKEEKGREDFLSNIFRELKKILNGIDINDVFLKENIEFCCGNMSAGTKTILTELVKDYNSNCTVLAANHTSIIETLWKIANIFYYDGHVHKSPISEINGRRIHFQYKTELYTAAMLYEKIAVMGDYNAYLKAASCCSDMGFYHIEELKKIKKEYYNRAAEKGVLEAYRYCDYMPNIFDKLIIEKSAKHYIAYFFVSYRRMDYSKCKKYLDLIIEKCSKKEKDEIIEELGRYSYEEEILAIKYLNGEIDAYKIKKEKNGCYIATCVYGSYDCPEAWTLRRYRDNILANTWYGRVFIKLYYATSPTIVKWFGTKKWFKKMWKKKLDKKVEKLQNNGVECSPYQDKDWN